MPTYTSIAILQPFLPKSAVLPDDLEVLKKCGFSYEETTIGVTNEPALYIFANEYLPETFLDEQSTESMCVEEILQGIITRSEGKVPWISLEFSHSCSKKTPDGFGGSAAFITADDIEEFSTCGWLQEKIEMTEKSFRMVS